MPTSARAGRRSPSKSATANVNRLPAEVTGEVCASALAIPPTTRQTRIRRRRNPLMNWGYESASGRCPWHLFVRLEFLGIAIIPLRCYNTAAHALARLTPVCPIGPLSLHLRATDLPCLAPV